MVTNTAFGATYAVTNTSDNIATSGSLRWAIAQANANPGPDIINITATGTVLMPVNVPIAITEEVTINGNAGYSLGMGSGTILSISANIVVIDGLKFVDNATPYNNLSGISANNADQVIIRNCTFTNCNRGVQVQNGEDILVHSNTFVGCGQNNASMEANNITESIITSRSLDFYNNTFVGGNNGISLNNVENTTFHTSGTSGIVLNTANGHKSLAGTVLTIINMDDLDINGLDFGYSGSGNVAGVAIAASNCDNLTLQNNTIDSRLDGFNISNSITALIHNNTFTRTLNGFPQEAIEIDGGSNITVTNNSMTNFGLNSGRYALDINGVIADVNGDRLNVTGNTFNACGNGVSLANMADLKVHETSMADTEILLPNTDGRKTCISTLFNLINCDNLVLEDFDFSFDNGSGNASGTAIFASNCDNLTLQNNTIDSRLDGFNITNSITALIHNNTFTRALNGTPQEAIEITGGSNIAVTNNSMTNYGLNSGRYTLDINGVIADVNGDRLNVTGNTFNFCGNGVSLANMADLKVHETSMADTEILLPDTDGRKACNGTLFNLINCDNLVLEDFDFSFDNGSGNAAGTAISASNCDNLTLQNNTIDSRIDGYNITNSITALIHNNTFTRTLNGTPQEAIEITGGSNITVTNNSMTNFGLSSGRYTLDINGVIADVNGDRLNVTGNTFNACGNGVSLANMADLKVHKTSMADTEILLPNTDGRKTCNGSLFNLISCDNLVLEDFDFSFDNGSGNSAGTAINANSCDNLVLQNNTIDSRLDGFNITNSITALIHNNTFTRTLNGITQEAIDIDGGSNITVTNNSMTSYGLASDRYALDISGVTDIGSGRLDVQGNTFLTCGNGVRLQNMDNLKVHAALSGTTEVHLPNNDGRTACTGTNLRTTNCDNQTLAGFDFSYAGSGTAGTGLHLNSADNVTLTDLIINKRSLALFIENSNDVSVDSLQADTGGRAIFTSNSNGTEITNSSFSNFTPGGSQGVVHLNSVGTSANTGDRLKMVANNFGSNTNTGIYISNSNSLIISDGSVANTHITLADQDSVWRTGNPIHLFNSPNTSVSKINIKQNGNTRTGSGILFQDSDNSTVSNVTVSGRNSGISFNESLGGTVSYSLLQENNNGIFANGVIADPSSLAVSNSNFICNTIGINGNNNATINAANNFWGAADGSTTDGGSGDTYFESTLLNNEGFVNNTTTFLTTEDAASPIGGQKIFNELTAQLTNGQTATSMVDSTDYGTVNIGSSLTRQFRIANNGLDTMFITGITSSHAQFTLDNIPAFVLCMDTLAFDVIYTPTTETTSTSTIAIAQTNCYNTEFEFNVAGLGFQPCAIVINSVVVGDESCADANDGTLTVNATCVLSCNSSPGDIRYSIDGTNFLNNGGLFTGLADGTYTVTVRDVNDEPCTATSTGHMVAAGSGPCCDIAITSVTPTHEGCQDANDGKLTVSATCNVCTNGVADIRYSIDGSTFLDNGGLFTGLADGTYTVTVRAVNDIGCTDSNAGNIINPGQWPVLYTHNNVCYETLADAIAATGGTSGIAMIHATAIPNEDNTIPAGVTVQLLSGIWTNQMVLKNNGLIIIDAGAQFINGTGGTYKGRGVFNGNFQNNGMVRPGE
ncbi:MAG: right-handed parallel beta-helix repeat-containing protein [Saprospiraceae bacterium]|nr:right-handed parallel beta-helix repeat-containing protein [Saprospiraceae bacterium]